MSEDVFGLLGEQVAGVYEVESVVAEGGFGVVYRAHHSGFKAPVALKCLKIPQHMSDEMRTVFRAQFQAEAELLFKLSSAIQNVVRPLHVDAIVAPSGTFMPFMVLEWLEGETLQAYADRRGPGQDRMVWLRELVELLTPAAQALHLAHHFPGADGEVSIVHRDIKPENLFVAISAGKQLIKVLDFGIAKARSAASQGAGRHSTNSNGLTSFTPAYGAPEQWVPKRYGQTGPWTDVWGLALTVVELLSGRPVLDGDHASMMGSALDPERRPTPRAEGVDVSPEIEAVFLKALAVDPRDRYPEAGTFWEDLRRVVGLGVSLSPRPLAAGMTSVSDTQEGDASHNELDFGADDGPALELLSLPPFSGGLGTAKTGPQRFPVAPVPVATARTIVADVAVQQPSAWMKEPEKNFAPRVDLPSEDVVVRPAGPPFWHFQVVPACAVICGLCLSLLGEQFAATVGKVFTIGPVRLTWITIPMVLGGALAIVLRFIRRGVRHS